MDNDQDIKIIHKYQQKKNNYPIKKWEEEMNP